MVIVEAQWLPNFPFKVKIREYLTMIQLFSSFQPTIEFLFFLHELFWFDLWCWLKLKHLNIEIGVLCKKHLYSTLWIAQKKLTRFCLFYLFELLLNCSVFYLCFVMLQISILPDLGRWHRFIGRRRPPLSWCAIEQVHAISIQLIALCITTPSAIATR